LIKERDLTYGSEKKESMVQVFRFQGSAVPRWVGRESMSRKVKKERNLWQGHLNVRIKKKKNTRPPLLEGRKEGGSG